MKAIFTLSIWASLMVSLTAQADTVIIVTGNPGETEYAAMYASQSQAWIAEATKAQAAVIEIGQAAAAPAKPDADLLSEALVAAQADTATPLWLVLNGHGTWDGKTARFNLRGSDVTDDELAAQLKPLKRPLIVINTASSSAPFLTKLSGPGRTIITATKSGSEQNLTRLGTYLAKAITDPAADLDTDGSISMLEAYLSASRQTTEFYKTNSRLATEHALLDDNGDALGTPADWFKGLRAAKQADAKAAVDGITARHLFLHPPANAKQWTTEQSKQRDLLEAKISALREAKPQMKEDDYFAKLEAVLLELAELTKSAQGQ